MKTKDLINYNFKAVILRFYAEIIFYNKTDSNQIDYIHRIANKDEIKRFNQS